jgi:hypothetical protein
MVPHVVIELLGLLSLRQDMRDNRISIAHLSATVGSGNVPNSLEEGTCMIREREISKRFRSPIRDALLDSSPWRLSIRNLQALRFRFY